MAGALANIKVLDLTHYIAGPYCAMLLGDMGAEVIKVEKPGEGEGSRNIPPFVNDLSMYYAHHNKNKKSITLNLRSKRGQELLFELVKQVDVLVENFRPGTLDKMGLTKEKLDQLNPNIIVTSISGFGQSGPYRDRLAFDAIAQAMSGIMYMTGTKETGPLLCGTFMADYLSGVFAAFGTLSALYNRDAKNGTGQRVDVALLDSIFATNFGCFAYYAKTGKMIEASGNEDKSIYPADRFNVLDGYVYINAALDALFARLCEAMDRTDLLDKEIKGWEWRNDHRDEVRQIISEWTSKHTVSEVISSLEKHGIPVGPVYNMDGVLKDPHMNFRKTFEFVDFPEYGKISLPGIVPRLSETPGSINRNPPRLGEHTEEIYSEWLGLTRDELAVLREAGDI